MQLDIWWEAFLVLIWLLDLSFMPGEAIGGIPGLFVTLFVVLLIGGLPGMLLKPVPAVALFMPVGYLLMIASIPFIFSIGVLMMWFGLILIGVTFGSAIRGLIEARIHPSPLGSYTGIFR